MQDTQTNDPTEAELHPFGAPPKNLPVLSTPPRQTSATAVHLEAIDLGNKKQRQRFLDVTTPIYENDPHYVAPLRFHMMKFLNPRENPAFSKLTVRAWIALRQGQAVGRITAHIDHAYTQDHGTRTGFFGFFESVNDQTVAHALISKAEAWLREQQVEEIFGPMSFNTNHQVGMLVENFDRPPAVETPYNPAYYEHLITSYGFGKAKDLHAYWIDVNDGMAGKRARIKRIAEKVKKKNGVSFRNIDFSKLDRELEPMYELYTKAWQKNWGFVFLDKEEFIWTAKDFKDIAHPELVLFVEVEGKPVGFCATLPDINENLPKDGRLFPFGWLKLLRVKKTRYARLFTFGLLPEYRKRGLESLMLVETVERAQKLGIEGGEVSWTLEDNHLINRTIEAMDAKLDRKHRIFGARIEQAQ